MGHPQISGLEQVDRFCDVNEKRAHMEIRLEKSQKLSLKYEWGNILPLID